MIWKYIKMVKRMLDSIPTSLLCWVPREKFCLFSQLLKYNCFVSLNLKIPLKRRFSFDFEFLIIITPYQGGGDLVGWFSMILSVPLFFFTLPLKLTKNVMLLQYPQIKVGTFLVIDPTVNRTHHGGACSCSSLVYIRLKTARNVHSTTTGNYLLNYDKCTEIISTSDN